MTYDEYYGNKDMVSVGGSSIKIGEGGMIEKSLTFEEWAKDRRSENAFENELLELEYKFWETDLERE